MLERGLVGAVGPRPGEVGRDLPVAGGEVRQLVGGEAVETVAGRPIGQLLELGPPGSLAGGERRRGGRPLPGQTALPALPLAPVHLQQVVQVAHARRGGVVGESPGDGGGEADPRGRGEVGLPALELGQQPELARR